MMINICLKLCYLLFPVPTNKIVESCHCVLLVFLQIFEEAPHLRGGTSKDEYSAYKSIILWQKNCAFYHVLMTTISPY